MKKWKLLSTSDQEFLEIKDVINTVLSNREVKNIKNFLNPKIEEITLNNAGIKVKEFEKFKKRIEEAIDNNEKIIIFGDYDVDGICASAILWETLYAKTKNVFPYIPERIEEGYGLSINGIDNLLTDHPDTKLIITVDNGIVAYKACDYAKEKGIDVVVTDHHVGGGKNPECLALIHTTELCGAGVAWTLAKELNYESAEKIHEKLELAALATIADVVPLKKHNRSIVKEGLKILSTTKRIGLQKLFKIAGIDKEISVYDVGHVIAPRLNASGRLTHAITGLRLLCTNNSQKAVEYAEELDLVNKERQKITFESASHAKLQVIQNNHSQKISVAYHESYNPGIVGLIASHLVESYYKPSFAISIGETVSKGSARSVSGVNIVELLRSVSHVLSEVGGHPMAAGFSFQTSRLEEFILELSSKADETILDEMLERFLNVDLFLSFNAVSKELYDEIQDMAPFGMGNPEPVFATKGVTASDIRKLGKEKNHLKFFAEKDGKRYDAIAFNMADTEIAEGDTLDLAYQIDENEWNGRKKLQLKIKDIALSS